MTGFSAPAPPTQEDLDQAHAQQAPRDGDGCQVFVDVWGEEVRRRIPHVRELRQQHQQDIRNSERLEDWSPTDHDLYVSSTELWAAEHLLLVAAHQLDRWASIRAVELAGTDSTRNETLRLLRNALEHASESEYSPDSYSLIPESPRDRSLSKLTGSSIRVGSGGGSKLFGHLSLDELEQLASNVTTHIDYLIEAGDAAAYELAQDELRARGDETNTHWRALLPA